MARATKSLAAAIAISVGLLLSGCLPIAVPGGDSIDTDAIAGAVTDTSDSIDETTVDTSIDGLTTSLYVRPVIATDGLTASELDDVLRAAYQATVGEVASIEIRTVDSHDEPISLLEAASELGIEHLDNMNSVTYSTAYLDEEYGG